MYILPSQKVSVVEEKGTAQQKAAALYFDKNGNGIYEAQEADEFNSSKIEADEASLTITSKDGYVDKYESISQKHDDSYYTQGYIPVAVIDDFTMGFEDEGIVQHGTEVSNTIKMYNPDISISKFDTNQAQYWNIFQRAGDKILTSFPGLERLLYSNKVTESLCDGMFRSPESCNNALQKAIDKVQSDIDSGTKYAAVNLSQAPACDYETINGLVSEELGVEITPENIAQYKSQIKDILRNKQNEKISYYTTNEAQENISIKSILSTVDKIEGLGIPVYAAGTYNVNDGDTETFSLYSLADNVLTVEAGVEQDGGIIHDESISHNSFAVDENTGKRRIEDSRLYDGNSVIESSTSLSTPMALAKALKEKYS